MDHIIEKCQEYTNAHIRREMKRGEREGEEKGQRQRL